MRDQGKVILTTGESRNEAIDALLQLVEDYATHQYTQGRIHGREEAVRDLYELAGREFSAKKDDDAHQTRRCADHLGVAAAAMRGGFRPSDRKAAWNKMVSKLERILENSGGEEGEEQP